jgi:hypothetical protein
MRFNRKGLIESGRKLGYKVRISETFQLLEANLNIIDLGVSVDIDGRINILNIKNSRTSNKIFRFYINKNDAREVEFEEKGSFIDKWLNNKPFSSAELNFLLSNDSNKKWAIESYKKLMDSRLHPERVLKMVVENTEIKYDEDDLERFWKGMEFNESETVNNFAEMMFDLMEEEVEESKNLNVPEVLDNFLGFIDQTFKCEKPEIYEYKSVYKLTVSSRQAISDTKCFDTMNDDLNHINLPELYSSQFKFDIQYNSEWFNIFKILVDYDSRPMLQKKHKLLEDERIEQLEKLGKFTIISSGLVYDKDVENILGGISDIVPILTNQDQLPPGIYIKTPETPGPVRLKFKGWRSGERMQELFDTVMDKIGIKHSLDKSLIRDEENMILDRRTGEFKRTTE